MAAPPFVDICVGNRCRSSGPGIVITAIVFDFNIFGGTPFCATTSIRSCGTLGSRSADAGRV